MSSSIPNPECERSKRTCSRIESNEMAVYSERSAEDSTVIPNFPVVLSRGRENVALISNCSPDVFAMNRAASIPPVDSCWVVIRVCCVRSLASSGTKRCRTWPVGPMDTSRGSESVLLL